MKEIIKKMVGQNLLRRLRWFRMKWMLSRQQKQAEQLRRVFYSSFIRADDLCFDVGANIGNRISPLLQIGAQIVAVEPQESCYRFLQYKFGNKIKLVTKGLGEAEAVKDFHISNASIVSSFSAEWINAVKDSRFKTFSWDQVVQVQMTTLDALIAEYGLPAFIKIDVEGYELQVLRGLTKPVPIISFEYTVPEQVNHAIHCIEEIEKHNVDIECNYSIGESMHFQWPTWVSGSEMKEYIRTQAFINSEFGDIYVRSIKHI